jgi:hypothetical protein
MRTTLVTAATVGAVLVFGWAISERAWRREYMVG